MLIFLLFFYFVFFVHAASAADVAINEIAWMGSLPDEGETVQQAANDEWIELYNKTAEPLSLAGWELKAADGNPEIILSGFIEPQGYFLLSRANQKAGSITADLVYAYKNNALSNDGEQLKLFDAQGNLIDEVGNVSQAWFAGANDTKQTMERKNPQLTGSDPVNWGTSVSAGGTPKAQNSIFFTPPPPPLPSAEQQTTIGQPEPDATPLSEEQPPQQIEIATTTATTTPTLNPPSTESVLPSSSTTQNEGSYSEIKEIKEVKKVKEVKEVKEVKIIKKNENKNASSSLADITAPPSRQVAAIGEVAPRNKNIFVYALAPLLALLSAGAIFMLNKRLQK